MISKILEKFKGQEGKTILSNFVAMATSQGFNLILPLITFPYLVRILEVEMFGLIMFAQAFMVYFSMTVDYGFNLSGIREITRSRGDKGRIEQIFNSIMLAKIFLIIISFVIMNIIVFSFDKFSSDWILYYLSFGMVLGSAMFPTWFFQGMENMKYVTILNVVAKSIFTFLIFVFVKTKADFLMVPLFNALGYISVGLISLYIIKYKHGVNFRMPKRILVKIQMIRGWHIFISKISTNLYTASNTFILGIFTTTTIVGYFVIAEKVIRIITTVFLPFYQAIFPYVVNLTKKSKKEAYSFLFTSGKWLTLISLLIFIFFISFKNEIFETVFKTEGTKSIDLAVIISPLILILPLSSLVYNVLVVSFKWDSFLSKATIIGAVINLFSIFLFFNILDSKSMSVAYAIVLTEAFLLIYGLTYVIWKFNLNKNNTSRISV